MGGSPLAERGGTHHVENELIVLDRPHGTEPAIVAIQPEAEAFDFHRADDFLQGFLECPADRHRLTHALHLRRQRFIGLGKLLESPAGHLHDDVIDRGLETGAGGSGDVVLEFVEGVSNGKFGRDLGDGKARGLAGERATARDAGIHLDHHHLELAILGPWVHGELHVAATRLDAHGPHDRERCVTHALVFLVRQCQDRRDGDAVARVDAHGIDVLDAADDDAVVLLVADDFEFEFLPADHGLVDLDLGDHAGGEPARDNVLELFEVVGDAAATTAQREGGADDRWQANLLEEILRVWECVDDLGLGQFEADLFADVLEYLAVFGAMDDLAIGTDHLDAILRECAVVPHRASAVEGRLTAQRWQDRIDARASMLLERDDLADGLGRDGLDVRPIAELRIGHDGRWVAVDQHDAIPLGLERLAGLRARIVKLAALANHDRA